MYHQQTGQNGGPNYYIPGGQPAPTTILPKAPVTLVPLQQQLQTMQERMKGLQFSTHPRPNFVTAAYGGEPELPNVSSSPSGPYTGAPGTPQAPRQPRPFVPPTTRPTTSTLGTPSPSTRQSLADTSTFSTGTASPSPSQDPQTAILPQSTRGVAASEPLPSPLPPSILHFPRPSPEVESPHSIINTNNSQYVDPAHLSYRYTFL